MKNLHYVKCNECNELFNNATTLSNHMTTAHMLQCESCDYSFLNKEISDKHMKTVHPAEVLVICGECGKSFLTDIECYEHINDCVSDFKGTNAEIPIFSCNEDPLCKKSFIKMADLKDHTLLVHKPEINSSEQNSEEKIDLSLGILHSNIDSAIQRLDGKFQLSLNMIEEIIDNQNKKIRKWNNNETRKKPERAQKTRNNGQKETRKNQKETGKNQKTNTEPKISQNKNLNETRTPPEQQPERNRRNGNSCNSNVSKILL